MTTNKIERVVKAIEDMINESNKKQLNAVKQQDYNEANNQDHYKQGLQMALSMIKTMEA